MEWLLVILLAWQNNTPPVVLQIPVETEELCEQSREKVAWSLAMLGEPARPRPTEGEGTRIAPEEMPNVIPPSPPIAGKVAATCLKVRNHPK